MVGYLYPTIMSYGPGEASLGLELFAQAHSCQPCIPVPPTEYSSITKYKIFEKIRHKKNIKHINIGYKKKKYFDRKDMPRHNNKEFTCIKRDTQNRKYRN